MRERKISPRHSSAILQAFSNGVTQRIGLEHVIVGRSAEIEVCQSSRSSLKEKFLSWEVRRKPMTATARSAVVIHPLKRGKISFLKFKVRIYTCSTKKYDIFIKRIQVSAVIESGELKVPIM